METRSFAFRFAPSYRRAARLFGVTGDNSVVTLGPSGLLATFGRWRAATEFSNITAVELTGPYRFHRTAGPARYSLADRGLTFATNGDRGVCITFREPIAGLEPTGRLLHPNLTLTVADCEGLAHALALGMVAPGVDAS